MGGIIKLNTRYYAAGMREDGSYDRELYGYREETQGLDFDRSAFFLVDVYGLGYDDEFTEPERPSLLTKQGFYREREMIRENIAPALNAARKARMKIVDVTNVDPGVGTEKSEFAKLMKRSFFIDIADIIGPGSDDTAYSDIVAPRKTPIIAPADGVVTFAGWREGLGRTIEIRHGYGYRTTYGHSEKLMVKKGERIERGDTIALLGSSGRSTGPHLHYEIRQNSKLTNPYRYVIE